MYYDFRTVFVFLLSLVACAPAFCCRVTGVSTNEVEDPAEHALPGACPSRRALLAAGRPQCAPRTMATTLRHRIHRCVLRHRTQPDRDLGSIMLPLAPAREPRARPCVLSCLFEALHASSLSDGSVEACTHESLAGELLRTGLTTSAALHACSANQLPTRRARLLSRRRDGKSHRM